VTESSPLVWRKRVFFGDRNGDLWALSTETHKVVWKYHTGGKIAGAPAMLNDRIVVGSYDGAVYCFTYDGKVIWKRSTSGALGVTDPFYGTAALAYNTVYLGSIGRHVFAFDLSNGGTRWKTSTGAWIYASPAVWKGLVLIGCFDTWFYALDAANGRLVWKFNARGKISGSPTVLNGVVYFSTLNWKTFGLDARTGKQLWTFGDGKYTPVTADKERLYLCGALKLYCLVPSKK
jgi:outer membrane protein assembly factor BamB